MLDEVVVEIGLGIAHQALLMQLQLMQKEHQHDRDEQREYDSVQAQVALAAEVIDRMSKRIESIVAMESN